MSKSAPNLWSLGSWLKHYVFGDQIAGLIQDADGVDVAFAGGGRRRFDLVVGADGLQLPRWLE